MCFLPPLQEVYPARPVRPSPTSGLGRGHCRPRTRCNAAVSLADHQRRVAGARGAVLQAAAPRRPLVSPRPPPPDASVTRSGRVQRRQRPRSQPACCGHPSRRHSPAREPCWRPGQRHRSTRRQSGAAAGLGRPARGARRLGVWPVLAGSLIRSLTGAPATPTRQRDQSAQRPGVPGCVPGSLPSV